MPPGLGCTARFNARLVEREGATVCNMFIEAKNYAQDQRENTGESG